MDKINSKKNKKNIKNIKNKKFGKINVIFVALFLGLSLTFILNITNATVYPSYNNQSDCRGCHGNDSSTTIPTPATRHHTLVVNGLFQCQDCHPVIYDNSTGSYSTQMIRDCLVCHVNKNHTSVHHYIAMQGLFQCQDCHPVIYDNSTGSYSTQVTWDCPVCHSTVLSIQNGSSVLPTPTPIPAGPIIPMITSFDPISPVNDVSGDSRKFEILTDQAVNVTWYINDSQVQYNESTSDSNYTNDSASLGTWNVSAIGSNENGSVTYFWNWKVTTSPIIPSPTIMGYVPIYSPVEDTANAGAYRRFGIAVDQNANVTWYINGSLVQSDENITQSVYNNTNLVVGTWNVSAIAENNNGIVSHNWTWDILPEPLAIISYTPIFSSINDVTGDSRTFDILLNQNSNITWYVNDSLVQTNDNILDSNYTNDSAPVGIWNVSAVAENNNGLVSQNWIWNVTRNPNTPTGSHSNVKCSICHNQPILRSEQTCYQCHNNSANSANGTNIYAQFTMSTDTYSGLGTNKGYYNTVNTIHDITDISQNFSSTKIECTDCHSAHSASRQNVVIDPDNLTSFNKTMTHPGTGKVILDYITYCLKCHDNTWSRNVSGPSIITDISDVFYETNISNKGDWHGVAGGDKYNNSFLIGPYLSQKGKNYVPAMPCNDCHDSHGSSGLYHLKTLKDQYGNNVTITSQNINSSDVAHWCSNCHKDPMQKNLSTQTAGNCLTSKCHSHGKRF